MLVLAFHFRLAPENTKRMRIATGAGLVSVLFLLANAGVSMYGVLHAGEITRAAGEQINLAATVLAIVVLVSSGIWYLLANLVAMRAAALPKGLCRLGIAVGITSVLPPLAIVSLVLNIVWSILVARHLSRGAWRT